MSKATAGNASKTFRDLKVGDEVFVVHQKRRECSEQRMEWLPVTRVGTKFAYVRRWHEDEPFSRKDGASHHSESNVRQNGLGFDVYIREEDYRQVVSEWAERCRLRNRLVVSWGDLVDLSPELVAKLNRVVDEHDATVAGRADG